MDRDSYGDGNVYRGQVCRDPEIKTIEINRYNADVERLLAAIPRVIEIVDLYFGRENTVSEELKAALEPFNK